MYIPKQLFLTAAMFAGATAATARALTWTGGTSGMWSASSESWRDADGRSAAWADGASATFAGPAAVTVDGAVSASTVTFDGGAVSLADAPTTATYAASFLQTSNVVLFPNASLASVTGIGGLMADAVDHKTYVLGQEPLTAYWVRNDGRTLTAQLQHFSLTEHFTKCIGIELTQQGADIVGRALYATYYRQTDAKGNVIKDLNVLGSDLSPTGAGTAGTVSTDASTHGYGVESLTLSFAGDPLTLTSPNTLATTNGAVATISAPLVVDAPVGVADGVAYTNAPFLSLTPVKVIENASLDDVKRLRGKLGGNYITTYQRDHLALYADSYHLRRPSASTLTVQLQSWSDVETYTKCVLVELSQQGNDIYACAKNAYALRPRYTNGLGCDFEDVSNANVSVGTVAESGTANGYGIYDLEVVMNGEETVLPQTLSINGDTVHRYTGFLPGTSTRLFENLSLDDVVCLGANFGGTYITTYAVDRKTLHAQTHYATRVGDTLTLQLQAYAPREQYTKAVKVELTQVGADIYGRAVAAYCYTVNKNLDMRGIDFETYPDVTRGTVAYAGTEAGYGVYDLCLVSTNAGRVEVNGPLIQLGDFVVNGTLQLNDAEGGYDLVYPGAIANEGALLLTGARRRAFSGAISGSGAVVVDGVDADFSGKATYTGGLRVRNGRVRIQENRALPCYGPIEVEDGGELVLCPALGPSSPGFAYNFDTAVMGGTNPVFVAKGGTFTLGEGDGQAWFVTGTQGGRRFIVDGGTLHTRARWLLPSAGIYYHQNYFANLVLKNAALVKGTPFQAGSTLGMVLSSSGEGTNVLASGFLLVQSKAPVALKVEDGTLDVTGAIADHPDYPGHDLVKEGDGVALFSHANTYTGDTIVKEGTLRLLVDGSIPSASDVALAGGTLDAGAVSNACATLAVTASSVLNVAGCDLAFADSSAVAWTDGADVTVTGDLKHSRVRFGTNGSGLTAEQVKALRFEGHRVTIDAEGYIRPIPASSVIIVR